MITAISNNDLSVFKNDYVIEIRRRISKIQKETEKKIIIVWIPEHRGIEDNEIADSLAKKATRRK